MPGATVVKHPYPETIEKTREIWAMRVAGATYREIATALDLSRDYVKELAHRAMRESQREVGDDLRDLEGERLDRLQRAHWQQALAGDERAASLVLRIMERRARLYGLDAPAKAQVDVTVSTEQIDSRMAELRARLA